MALTKTTNILSVRYTAETLKSDGHPMDEPHCLWVETQVIVDDPELNDPHFPIKTNQMYRLYHDSDVSKEPQLVQDIWNVIFNDHGLASPNHIPKIGPDSVKLKGSVSA